MERFLGPLAFGLSGALFGLWVLRADSAMGFAAPRQTAPRAMSAWGPGDLRG